MKSPHVWAMVLLGGAVGMNATTAVINPNMLLRVGSLVVAVVCAVVYGYRYGVERMRRSFMHATDWLPDEISWHQDDDGVRHAFVTQQSGKLVTVAIPDEIDTPGEALQFVMQVLAEGE